MTEKRKEKIRNIYSIVYGLFTACILIFALLTLNSFIVAGDNQKVFFFFVFFFLFISRGGAIEKQTFRPEHDGDGLGKARLAGSRCTRTRFFRKKQLFSRKKTKKVSPPAQIRRNGLQSRR